MEKVKKVQTDQKTGAQATDPMTGEEALDVRYHGVFWFPGIFYHL